MIGTQLLKLPHILKNELPYIACHQLASLLKKPTPLPFDKIILLDARSPFEFERGHIKSAKNINFPSQIAKILDYSSKKNLCGICYCELSQSRGPNLYRYIRSYDYEKNNNDPSHLSLPQLYILDGGYKGFHSEYSSLCSC